MAITARFIKVGWMIIDLGKVPIRDQKGHFYVVVESPRGAHVKLSYHSQLKAFVYKRCLPKGLQFPYDWGFIPNTEMEDGDPVDALILSEESTYPGVVIACRSIGVVRVEEDCPNGDGRQKNDRIIAVPANHQSLGHINKLSDLSAREKAELEHFFTSATYFEEKNVKITGWDGPDAAELLINRYSTALGSMDRRVFKPRGTTPAKRKRESKKSALP